MNLTRTMKDDPPSPSSESWSAPPLITRDELNLASFPFALPSYHNPQNRDEIHITFAGKDRRGKPITREWLVYGSSKFGLPLANDEEVFLALLHLWQQTGFKGDEVVFTERSLLRFLGWTDNQQAYKRLELALDRLSGVRIKCDNTFWSRRAEDYVVNVGLLATYKLWRKENPDRKAVREEWEIEDAGEEGCLGGHGDLSEDKGDAPDKGLSRVVFHAVIVESVKSGHVKTLDFSFYRSLRYPLARKLFRLLDKLAYQKRVVEFDLKVLAERLAMTGNSHSWMIKDHLKESHEELKRHGFLEDVCYEKKNGSTWVRYTVTSREKTRGARFLPPMQQKAHQETPPPILDHPLAEALTTRGITRRAAGDLVKTHGEQVVAEQIEAFDHRVKRGSREITKNPPGFLRRAIEGNFQAPKGLITKAEQERKHQAREAAERRKVEMKAAEERAEQERLDRFERLWNSQPEADRAAVIAAATTLLNLNPFAQRALDQERAEGREEGPGHEVLRIHRNEILAQRFPDSSGKISPDVPPTKRSRRQDA